MTDCYCDYDPPIFCTVTHPTAKIVHKCGECGGRILPGQKYERACGSWEHGSIDVFKVCARCLSLRDYVQAHVPCLCWAYGNLIDDCMNEAEGWAHEAPGLLFGSYRRKILIERNR